MGAKLCMDKTETGMRKVTFQCCLTFYVQICDEPSQFAEGERPRPQGSSPVEEYPEKYSDSDKEVQSNTRLYWRRRTEPNEEN